MKAVRAGQVTAAGVAAPASAEQMDPVRPETPAASAPAATAEATLRLPKGLFGFPGPLEFAVMGISTSDHVFRILHSVGPDHLAFALVDPSYLFTDYAPVASAADLADVELAAADQAIWMVIANIPGNLAGATLNLKAPLLINPFRRLARQVILEADYPVRYPLMPKQGETKHAGAQPPRR